MKACKNVSFPKHSETIELNAAPNPPRGDMRGADNDNHSKTIVWPQGYEMRSDGLYFEDARISGPFILVGNARDAGSNGWGLMIEWNDRDGITHNDIIGRGDLIGNGNDIFRRLMSGGLELPTQTAKLNQVREVLAKVECTARVRLVGRSGWYGMVFVPPHKTIGQSVEQVRWYGAPSGPRYTEAGTLHEWKNSVAAQARGNSRMILALSVALSGPCIDLLQESNVGFHLRGASSTGKTTLLIAGGSVWGGGGPNGFVQTWRATANGLEAMAAAHSGTCLFLDELSEINAREASEAVYALGNGHGKARAGRGGEARQRQVWRVPFLSSGEIALSDKIAEDRGRVSKVGLDMRLIDLEADAGAGFGVFEELDANLTPAQFSGQIRSAAMRCYGTAGPAFVQKLAGDPQIARERLDAWIAYLLGRMLREGDGGQIARVARAFAIVGAAGELARELLDLPWCKQEPLDVAVLMFQEWREARGSSEAGEFARGWEAILAAIEQHGSRFEDHCSNYQPMPVRDRLGVRKVIRGVRCWAFLVPGWKEVLSPHVNPAWFAKQLLARGKLCVRDDKDYETVEKINGTSVRLIAIPESEINAEMPDKNAA